MTHDAPPDDVVLGRTLAETARLNAPAVHADRSARETLRRTHAAKPRYGIVAAGMLVFAGLFLLLSIAAIAVRG